MTYIPNSPEEAEFLKNYDASKYPGVGFTSDIVIFTIHNNELAVLLVKRGGHPYKGAWALPGGFVNPDEDANQAALRELKEETGIDPGNYFLEQLKTYSAPERDPRMRVVSTAYIALLPHVANPVGGDDADEARFFAVKDIFNPEDESDRVHVAFDHLTIIQDGLERAMSKLEYTPLAAAFLDEPFTLADMRRVYEKVWQLPEGSLHASGFRRKVLSTPGFIESVGEKGESQFPEGRSADLYRRGTATVLYPPIQRKDPQITKENQD